VQQKCKFSRWEAGCALRSKDGLRQRIPEFWARLAISITFSVFGFAIVMLGLGDQASARMAAGWLGAVLGFWLR
jgi:hypothetical protein